MLPAGVFAYPPPYGIAAPCGTDWTTACAALSDAVQQALTGTPATAQIWAGPGAHYTCGTYNCSRSIYAGVKYAYCQRHRL